MSNTRVSLVPLAAGLLLFAAACSDSTSPAPSTAMTDAQASLVAEASTFDADEIVEIGVTDPASALALAPSSVEPVSLCVPVVTPFPPDNSDGDAVPDSMRVEFTSCVFTRGEMTHTLDGIIDMIDPTPTLTDWDVRWVFTGFTRTLANAMNDRTMSARFDGTRQVAATADTLGITMTNFLTTVTHANGVSSTHLKNWVVKFTADTPGSIVLGEPLPAGDLGITGSSVWERLDATWDVANTTPTPLHFNPACTVAPRFDGGTLVHVVTRNGVTATFQVEFTACGTYTVTRL
jgi:hypothetical protein